MVREAETLKVPIAPMGFSHVCARMCLQGGGVAVSGGTVSFSSCTITGNTATGGGGVYIGGGTVSFSLCTITGNTATKVRAHPQKFPSRLLTRLPALPAKCPQGVKRMMFQPFTVVTSQWHRIPYSPPRGPMSMSLEILSAPGQQP